MLNPFVLAFLTAFACVPTEGFSIRNNSSSISVSFFAINLSGCDLISRCDASVTIMCASVYMDWRVCNSTRKIRNNNNPEWPEVFTFDHQPGTSQRWRLDIKDHNLFGSKLMGSFPIILDEYAQLPGNLLQNVIPNDRGVLWMRRLELDSVES